MCLYRYCFNVKISHHVMKRSVPTTIFSHVNSIYNFCKRVHNFYGLRFGKSYSFIKWVIHSYCPIIEIWRSNDFNLIVNFSFIGNLAMFQYTHPLRTTFIRISYRSLQHILQNIFFSRKELTWKNVHKLPIQKTEKKS